MGSMSRRTSMRKKAILAAIGVATALASLVGYAAVQQELLAKPVEIATPLDRTVLPVPEPDYPYATETRCA